MTARTISHIAAVAITCAADLAEIFPKWRASTAGRCLRLTLPAVATAGATVMAPPGVGSNIFARLRVAESRIYNDNDVANQSVLVKHETPLNVHGVFDEIFDAKHTKCIGDKARWAALASRRLRQRTGSAVAREHKKSCCDCGNA